VNGFNGPYICPTGNKVLVILLSVGSAFLSLVVVAFFWLYWKAWKDKKMLQESFRQIEQGNQIKS
jgi:hypothetical protein